MIFGYRARLINTGCLVSFSGNPCLVPLFVGAVAFPESEYDSLQGFHPILPCQNAKSSNGSKELMPSVCGRGLVVFSVRGSLHKNTLGAQCCKTRKKSRVSQVLRKAWALFWATTPASRRDAGRLRAVGGLISPVQNVIINLV